MFMLRLHCSAPSAGVRRRLSHVGPRGCPGEPRPTALEPRAHLSALCPILILVSVEATPEWMGRDGGQVGRKEEGGGTRH